jgi:hypothetical protein
LRLRLGRRRRFRLGSIRARPCSVNSTDRSLIAIRGRGLYVEEQPRIRMKVIAANMRKNSVMTTKGGNFFLRMLA